MKSLLARIAPVALGLAVIGSTPATELPLGATGPSFELVGVDGARHRLEQLSGTAGTVIVFTSNRCPYSLLYEQRLIDLAREWQPRGFSFIAINPNNARVQQGENLDDMAQHAESRKFPFPYLRDGEQTVADAYGARVTPHVFVLDDEGKLVYRGRIDDSALVEEVETRDLNDALLALSRDDPVETSSTRAFGCTIKRDDAPSR